MDKRTTVAVPEKAKKGQRLIDMKCYDKWMILFGAQYLQPLGGKEDYKELINLQVWSDVFSAAHLFGVATEQLEKTLEYECPYTGYRHFWAVPYAIIGEDLSVFKEVNKTHSYCDLACDKSWWVGAPNRRGNIATWEINRVPRLFLGSGYTHGTRDYDGSNKRIAAKISLGNGNFLAVKTWVWYNK